MATGKGKEPASPSDDSGNDTSVSSGSPVNSEDQGGSQVARPASAAGELTEISTEQAFADLVMQELNLVVKPSEAVKKNSDNLEMGLIGRGTDTKWLDRPEIFEQINDTFTEVSSSSILNSNDSGLTGFGLLLSKVQMKEELAIDHAIPVLKIRERMNALLKIINGSTELKDNIIKNHRDWKKEPTKGSYRSGLFIVEDDEVQQPVVKATSYFLRLCCTDIGNLWILSRLENREKRTQEIRETIKSIGVGFGEDFQKDLDKENLKKTSYVQQSSEPVPQDFLLTTVGGSATHKITLANGLSHMFFTGGMGLGMYATKWSFNKNHILADILNSWQGYTTGIRESLAVSNKKMQMYLTTPTLYVHEDYDTSISLL